MTARLQQTGTAAWPMAMVFAGITMLLVGFVAAVAITVFTIINPVHALPALAELEWSKYQPSQRPVPYMRYEPVLWIWVHEPQLRAFSALLEQDVANHGGWNTRPSSSLPREFAVPRSYLSRLEPLTTRRMTFVEWSHMAAATPPKNEAEADLAVTVSYWSYQYERGWAKWSFIAAGATFAAGVIALLIGLGFAGKQQSRTEQ